MAKIKRGFPRRPLLKTNTKKTRTYFDFKIHSNIKNPTYFLAPIFILLTLTFSTSLTQVSSKMTDYEGHQFLPKNNMQIFANDPIQNGMTKEIFLSIIDRVAAVYAPIVLEKENMKLIINRRWDDPEVNAEARKWKDSWRINITGGLARHPLVTFDGLMIVLCHEVGHFVGGAPKDEENKGTREDIGGYSYEGQSDYFATAKCMKKILENDDNISVVANMQVDAGATEQCQEVYKTPEEVALCQRLAMAAKSSALLTASMRVNNPHVDFNKPDLTKVAKTIEGHLQGQCRLDTYFHGALCDKSHNDDFSKTDPAQGACTPKEGYKKGYRPYCWYKPSESEI